MIVRFWAGIACSFPDGRGMQAGVARWNRKRLIVPVETSSQRLMREDYVVTERFECDFLG